MMQLRIPLLHQVYDLKGSMRNRFQSNQNATLLDENLIRRMCTRQGLVSKGRCCRFPRGPC